MKRIATLFTLFIMFVTYANAQGNSYFNGNRVLIAYFSWSGNTQRVAEEIQSITGGDLFRIEPVTPYPTDYTECTEVALAERDNDARPAIVSTVENWSDYDIVFIGCPVWWHTAPMIISTFAESYDFNGKTVIPFCTYASTYRDETLQRIVDLTPDATHLTGFGSRSGSTSGVQSWLNSINEEWTENVSSTGINGITTSSQQTDETKIYDLSGRVVENTDNRKGVYIISVNGNARKILK